MPIERVTSLTHVIERSARPVGAPLAGFLIGIIGTANVLWLDAASFFISAGFVWLLIPRFQVQAKHESKSGKYLDELKDGLRFIARDHLILALVVMIMLTNFLDAIFSGVLQPVYVNEVYVSALNLGLLIAANGGGAVIGGLIYAAIGHRLPRHAIFVSAFMLTSFRFWVYALYLPILILVVTTNMMSIALNPGCKGAIVAVNGASVARAGPAAALSRADLAALMGFGTSAAIAAGNDDKPISGQ